MLWGRARSPRSRRGGRRRLPGTPPRGVGRSVPLLIDYAAGRPVRGLRPQAQRFADHLSPKDADDRFEEQLAGRRFSKVTTIDGYGYLRGWLDPITYAIFAAEHDRLTASSSKPTGPPPARCWAGTPTTPSSSSSPAPPANAPQTLCGSWPNAPRPSPAAPSPPPPRSSSTSPQDPTRPAPPEPSATTRPAYPPTGSVRPATAPSSPPSPRSTSPSSARSAGPCSPPTARSCPTGGQRPYSPAQAAAIRAKFRRCCHP